MENVVHLLFPYKTKLFGRPNMYDDLDNVFQDH